MNLGGGGGAGGEGGSLYLARYYCTGTFKSLLGDSQLTIKEFRPHPDYLVPRRNGTRCEESPASFAQQYQKNRNKYLPECIAIQVKNAPACVSTHKEREVRNFNSSLRRLPAL